MPCPTAAPPRRRRLRSPDRLAGPVTVVRAWCALVLLGVLLGSGSPAVAAPDGPGGPPRAPAAAAATGAPDTVPVGVWPLRPQPPVVGGFDPPDSPYGAGHRGVDLAGAAGQPVHAALPGRVSFAGRIAGRGVVVVDHGTTRTTYEPVASRVEVGVEVAAGARIGVLELVGSHCFPAACLHWGWIRGETYLDPLLLVGGGPVRLLPLWRDRPAGSAGGTADAGSPYGAWRAGLVAW